MRYRMYMRARARARVYKKASARYTRKRRQGQINSVTYTEKTNQDEMASNKNEVALCTDSHIFDCILRCNSQ